MKMLNRKIAAFTAVAVLLGAVSISVFATPGEGEAGIVFEAGDNEIIDPPTDRDLGDRISNGDLDFGKHKLSSKREVYHSVTEGAPGKQYAGFLIDAPHYDGWNVAVTIGDFRIVSGDPTMAGYTLKLVPWSKGAITTDDNSAANAAPIPGTVTLISGASENIFYATKSNGFGKWGCNWEGYLDVVGGSALEGIAKATMLWSITSAP